MAVTSDRRQHIPEQACDRQGTPVNHVCIYGILATGGISVAIASHSKEDGTMTAAIIGLLLGLVIGAGCRFFDIPSPAPPRLIGACLLLAMTVGFVTADHFLPPGKTLVEMSNR
jgi:XapX domain-containing protein